MSRSDPTVLRAQAIECRQLAQAADGLAAIGRLLQLAHAFDERADRIERKRALR